MPRKRSCLCCVLTLLLLPIFGPAALAQKQADSSLEGLTTIHVRVQLKSDPDGKGAGVTAEQLQSDAEGVLAMCRDESDSTGRIRTPPAIPRVSRGPFRSGCENHQAERYGLPHLQSQFQSPPGRIARAETRGQVPCPDMELNSFGTTDSPPALREKVKQAASQFIQDFKAENPK